MQSASLRRLVPPITVTTPVVELVADFLFVDGDHCVGHLDILHKGGLTHIQITLLHLCLQWLHIALF